MKKIFVLIASLCFLGIHSCSNELDLQPLDRLTTDTFYKTRSDFDGAIFASYSSIQDFWKITLTITDDVAADAVNSDQISRDVDALLIRSSDVPYAAVYTQIYEGIYRANLVLQNLDNEN